MLFWWVLEYQQIFYEWNLHSSSQKLKTFLKRGRRWRSRSFITKAMILKEILSLWMCFVLLWSLLSLLRAALQKFQIIFKSRYVGLLILNLLLLLDSWLIAQMFPALFAVSIIFIDIYMNWLSRTLGSSSKCFQFLFL